MLHKFDVKLSKAAKLLSLNVTGLEYIKSVSFLPYAIESRADRFVYALRCRNILHF